MFTAQTILRLLLELAALSFALPLAAEDFQGSSHTLAYDDPPISYSAQTPPDRVAKLQARLASGEVKLKWDEQFGWLPAPLEELTVPTSSQLVVFSQTSLQRRA